MSEEKGPKVRSARITNKSGGGDKNLLEVFASRTVPTLNVEGATARGGGMGDWGDGERSLAACSCDS